MYTREKSLAEWKLLVEGETGSTTVQAVEGLYRKLQGMLDKVTSKFPTCDSKTGCGVSLFLFMETANVQ